MTDYNDGKWHGWNGSECPIDQEAIVQIVTETGVKSDRRASEVNWASDGAPVLAFRVIKPAPPKPRECWSYGAHIHDTEAEAIAFRQAVADAHPGKGYETGPITKWIEVLG